MNEHAVALGRLGGARGGRARADSLTPERRSSIAREAARSRWGSKNQARDTTTRVLKLRLPAAIEERVRALALKSGRSISSLIGMAVENSLLDMKIRADRRVKAARIAAESGVDADVIEQVLFLRTLPPWERLARGLGRSRLGKVVR